MDKKDLSAALKAIAFFKPLSDSEAEYLAEHSQIFEFSAGENINEKCGDCVTVILDGSVSVFKNELLMRMMSAGSVSGVASLYGNTSPVSELRANTKSRAAFVDGAEIRTLIRKNPDFAESYITFLTSRIRFLNSKIRAYTSGSAEAKLAFHILYSDDTETGTVEIGVTMSSLADMLSIGRASLYRAFDALEASGAINRNGSTVKILDRKKLDI